MLSSYFWPKERTRVIACILALSSFVVGVYGAQGTVGAFVGSLDLRMSPNGRDATLLAPFTYVDPGGTKWDVPKGVTVNGASIPQVLWSVVGSPWTGKYREASVVHDYFCDIRTQPWARVHRTFYDAMLTNGVPVLQAKAMYAAVYRFGPRWNFQYTPKCPNCLAVPYRVEMFRPEPRVEEAKALREKVLQTDPSLADIEREADAAFVAEIQALQLGSPALIR